MTTTMSTAERYQQMNNRLLEYIAETWPREVDQDEYYRLAAIADSGDCSQHENAFALVRMVREFDQYAHDSSGESYRDAVGITDGEATIPLHQAFVDAGEDEIPDMFAQWDNRDE